MSDLIIVTGCSGEIGRVVINALKNRFQVVGIDERPPHEIPTLWTYLPLDLASALLAIRHKFGPKIVSFIHLGEDGTEKVVHDLKEFQIEQLIFMGKKRESESLIPTVHLEVAECYDEECHSKSLSKQIQKIYENRWSGHFFSGDKDRPISFLHLGDLAEAISLAIDKGKAMILNLGEEETISYDELQKTISRLISGDPWNTYKLPKFFGNGDYHPQSLNISETKKILGWNPKYSIRGTLPKMISLLKRDPVLFYALNGLKMPRWMKDSYCRPE